MGGGVCFAVARETVRRSINPFDKNRLKLSTVKAKIAFTVLPAKNGNEIAYKGSDF